MLAAMQRLNIVYMLHTLYAGYNVKLNRHDATGTLPR